MKSVELKEDERIDDLQRNHYQIIQNKKNFCFGMDAVLLSGFAMAEEGERVLDLGTGTGIIPILMEAKTKAKELYGLEIQSEVADMARRSVLLNDLSEKVHIVEGDIKEASALFGRASFDVVTSNPPYMEYHGGLKNPNMIKAISRHEMLCSLEDVIREATAVLKPGGRLYLVHRPFRLTDILETMRRYRMEPKRIKMVHPFADKEANMVLIEAVRGGKSMVKIEAPIIVYKDVGVYTDEIYKIYGY
ncbi:MAG: tRNA1(Val) (adenine(37)-N6)-methyltransferase [Lachnospiraceae bacterium]